MKILNKIVVMLLVVVSLLTMAPQEAKAAMVYNMDVTIYYKNEKGEIIAPTVKETVNGTLGQGSWESPYIEGYELKDFNDRIVTYQMLEKTSLPTHYTREGTATYTVYYTDTTSARIYYCYKDEIDSQAAPTVTHSGKIGTTFAITSPTITGFRASSTVVKGTYGVSADANIYVYYYHITYMVRYNANGGTGAPAMQTKGYSLDLKLSSTKPTRDGYTFLGWAESSTATTATYQPGETYSKNAGITLYAVWKKNATSYTITFDANGGSGAPSPMTKQKDVSLTLPSTKPTRTGYTFLGWSTSSTATTATYQPSGWFGANANTTLYAVWKKITYTISYNANGGNGAPSAQTKTHGVTLTITASTPTREGYSFEGWAESSSATTASYYPYSSFTANKDTTLYAVWKRKTYTITYNVNGGTGSIPSQTKTHGVNLTITTSCPSRTGYVFDGWSEDSNATVGSYFPNNTYSANKSTTFYAVWKKATYTVYYDVNGGTGSIPNQTKIHGTDLTITTSCPTRTGYFFDGWSENNGATVGSYFPNGTYSGNKSIVLYAVWTRLSYTVKYDANGGSGAPSSQTKYYGTNISLSSTKPTRTGYTFLGWAESSSATSAAYQAGGSYTANKSTTLYAVWQRITYTVSYNANGGSGAPSSQTKYYGTNISLSSAKPTRTGYTFLGWAESSSATSAAYQEGGSYTANKSITLYAVWQRITYTVSYNANGGSGAPSSQTKYHGTDITIPLTKPTRTGYTFQGWAKSSTSTTVSYTPGSQYAENNGQTLYAVWTKDLEQYIISYDANGGTSAPAKQTKAENLDLTLSSAKPTRTGYTFLGWSESKTATTATYLPGGIYIANKATTLYAVWQKTKYTISYNANGGSGAPSAQTKYYGDTLTLSGTKPTRTGYTFLGWSESSSATSASYQAGGSYTSNKSTTLYAVWKKNSYTVSYNANGGTGAPSSQTKYYGDTLTLSGTKPTRTGYTFLGWAESSSATSATYQADGSYTANKSTTLYAVWQRISYAISYNANGGTGAPLAQSKYYGDTLTLSSTKPTRTGYTFLGWAESGSATSATYQAGGSYTANKGTTLYAVWQIISYTISYNANGGTGAPGNQTKYYSDTLTLSSTKPTRTGYTFLGWSESSSATSAMYQAGGDYTANKSTTLYAVWRRISYTISYNANGGSGAPSSQTKYYGDNLTLAASVPTRTGYTFKGWSESSTATPDSGVIYPSSGTFTANKSTTLYAVWARITYTVSYNPNGGTGAPASQTKYYGDNLTLSSSVPTRTGYNFIGWAESSSAITASYQAGAVYTADKSITLFAVWKRIEYAVSFDANGGNGAPATQTKYYDIDMTLSATVPTRDRYRFLGWSDNKNATNPTYTSGSVYSANASVKLFAVWQFINYDFTLKELNIAPTEVYQYESVNISFRIDNGDKYAPYYAVPVEVLLNDKVIYSVDIDIAADGVKYINFNLGVGALLGTQTITVNVNKANLSKEIVSTDNTKSANFNVLKVVDAAVESVFTGNDSRYIEGTEVVSSFFVKNVSGNDIIPADNAKFVFKVYTLENGREKVIFTRTRTDIVVPKNKANIVYFKWTVPNGLAGTPCWCNGSIEIADGEPNKNNNATEFAISIVSMPKSDTPNTRYEDKAPVGYSPNIASPSLGTSSVSWNEWIYENNTFVLKEYGITVSGASPKLAPSVNAVTATKVNNVWTMRSGYGFTLEWEPKAVSTSGKTTAPADSYTQIQYVYAMYPEFSYSTTQDKYSTLDKVSGKFMLYKNVNAANEERIHFIPIYVSDGKYTVTVAAGEVWTPAGIIHAKRNVSLNIDGSIYDDWYQ